MTKTALITGASRGIGKVIAEKFASEGIRVLIASKSVAENKNLPGTIYSVKNEIVEKYPNSEVHPFCLNIRREDYIKSVVKEIHKSYGAIDILINNAGALYWKDIIDTPTKKYDLINDVNVRGSFILSNYCIQQMIKEKKAGHIIMHSPPLPNPKEKKIYKGKTGYMISKYGMTMTAMGISEEYKKYGIAGNTIWPATAIETAAVINNNLGTKEMWRKPEIIADAILEIVNENPREFTGNQLIDEDYLRTKGVSDFSKYQVIEGSEPPKLMDLFNQM